ncbi:DEAD/DEAH box helicase [Paenibacillus glycinis]|uniref:DEAD/DEAH box helicase n=1 Tax=Paenibacillus glycinis TaxID=2697035 RepID=UPI002E29B569|nr:helicase-related protein [Paenibacillus glycinis]
MKVVVYAVAAGKRSWAGWSLAPEIDTAYWLDPGYRAEAELAFREKGNDAPSRVHDRQPAAGAGEAGEAERLVAWTEPLPLGHALAVAERWPGGRLPGRRLDQTLSRLIADAWAGDARLGLPVPRQPAAHAAHVPRAAEPGAGRADAHALAARACRAAALLQGRALLVSEALALLEAAGAAGPAGAVPATWSAWAPALQLAALLGRLRLGGAVAPQPQPRLLRWRQALGARPRPRLRCQRCGSGTARMRRTPCAACGRACAYCEACLTMGRSRECGLLILGSPGSPDAGGSSPAVSPRSEPIMPAARAMPRQAAAPDLAVWNLSPAQTAAASAALAYINAPGDPRQPRRRFLLWAVTGAGKTEMIFPLIASALARGGRALIATPRRDVVLELDPRIRKAFPGAAVVTLYGGSEQRWEQGEITLATTHQLFRFREGFDLVIVDEIDAFPYHGDPMLHFAAENARTPDGTHVLLSATPPAALRAEARLGRLAHVRVPVRFHRHPLPVPALLSMPPVRKLLRQRGLPRGLTSALGRSIDRGAQLFVFVQQIRDVEPLAAKLRRFFPAIVIAGTSSQDPDRTDKVQQFRARAIRLLVTTTILERGVTVPKSDVFILDADGRLFDEASLIQMAGRAGRSKDDPAGNVYFCAPERTRAQTSAIAQIRSMNRIARRHGYLIENERR